MKGTAWQVQHVSDMVESSE